MMTKQPRSWIVEVPQPPLQQELRIVLQIAHFRDGQTRWDDVREPTTEDLNLGGYLPTPTSNACEPTAMFNTYKPMTDEWLDELQSQLRAYMGDTTKDYIWESLDAGTTQALIDAARKGVALPTPAAEEMRRKVVEAATEVARLWNDGRIAWSRHNSEHEDLLCAEAFGALEEAIRAAKEGK